MGRFTLTLGSPAPITPGGESMDDIASRGSDGRGLTKGSSNLLFHAMSQVESERG